MNHTAPSPPSPARGRGLLASRPLRPGDIIAVFDNNNPSLSPSTTTTTTSIAIPDSNHLDETCSFCLSPSTTPTPTPPVIKLRACTACRAASYCSPACQKRDWQHVHKLECSVFKRVQTAAVAASAGNGTKTPVLPTPVRALVQILLLLQAPRSGQAAAAAALVGELQSHVEEFRKGQSAGGGGGGGRGREHGSDGGGSGSSGGGREKAETVSWQDMQLQAMAALHYLGRDEWEMNMAMEILCKVSAFPSFLPPFLPSQWTQPRKLSTSTTSPPRDTRESEVS